MRQWSVEPTSSRLMAARCLAERTFREDLAYHPAEGTFQLLPLAEHLEDLDVLVPALIAAAAAGERLAVLRPSREAMDALRGYGWPGNIRQLHNALWRALVEAHADGSVIEPWHLPPLARPVPPRRNGIPSREELDALLVHHGTRVAVAKHLRKDPRTVSRWLKRHGLERGR